MIELEKSRKQVADLIISVLTERNCVREALKQFPHDTNDQSIDAAWHALVHYEADEDIRRRDLLYADEQNEYLEMIAFTLKEGNALPQNIITSYNKYHERASTPKSYDGILKSIRNALRPLI